MYICPPKRLVPIELGPQIPEACNHGPTLLPVKHFRPHLSIRLVTTLLVFFSFFFNLKVRLKAGSHGGDPNSIVNFGVGARKLPMNDDTQCIVRNPCAAFNATIC